MILAMKWICFMFVLIGTVAGAIGGYFEFYRKGMKGFYFFYLGYALIVCIGWSVLFSPWGILF